MTPCFLLLLLLLLLLLFCFQTLMTPCVFAFTPCWLNVLLLSDPDDLVLLFSDADGRQAVAGAGDRRLPQTAGD